MYTNSTACIHRAGYWPLNNESTKSATALMFLKMITQQCRFQPLILLMINKKCGFVSSHF
jgi:hypothetical protein